MRRGQKIKYRSVGERLPSERSALQSDATFPQLRPDLTVGGANRFETPLSTCRHQPYGLIVWLRMHLIWNYAGKMTQ